MGTQTQTPTLGRYRILGDLAHGGMATLSLAIQTGVRGFEKVVALKRMLPQYAATPEFLEMFLDEARIAARLDHSNIGTIYELGEVGGQYFISMEYLPGEDLNAIQKRSHLLGFSHPVAACATLAQSCAFALEYAHDLRRADGEHLGLVHRDVSPSNIIVTYLGVVKLVDFGIAKASTKLGRTRVGVFKGKLGYAAPEQLSNRGVDRRSDVFCLGVSLWELLTGQRLFRGSSETEIIDAIRYMPIVPPSSLRPEVPASLDAVTMRALERDPKDRFQTAGELASGLGGYLSEVGGPISAEALRAWLESLFGIDRSETKRAISQGRDLERQVPRLERMLADRSGSGRVSQARATRRDSDADRFGPRSAWSSDLPGGAAMISQPISFTSDGGPDAFSSAMTSELPSVVPEVEPSQVQVIASIDYGPTDDMRSPMYERAFDSMLHSGEVSIRPAPRVWRWVALAAAGATAAVAAFVVATSGSESIPDAGGRYVALRIVSTPAGASVFVDEEPTGAVTPATVRVAAGTRDVRVSAQLPGYQPATRAMAVPGHAGADVHFELQAAFGGISFLGVPDLAKLYVDGHEVSVGSPLSLAVGSHEVRVERGSRLIVAKKIEVAPGVATVDLAEGSSP